MYNYLFLHVTTRDISVSTLFFDNSVGYLVNVCANINFNLGVNITVSLTGKFFSRDQRQFAIFSQALCKGKERVASLWLWTRVYAYISLWRRARDNKVWKLSSSRERDVILCETAYTPSFDLA